MSSIKTNRGNACLQFLTVSVKKTHISKNNTNKVGKSFAIDCTTRFDKQSEVYFYRLL